MSAVVETRVTKAKEPEISEADKMIYGEPGAKTMLNKENYSEASPFLRLPGELRNKIYAYLAFNCDVELRYMRSRIVMISAEVAFAYPKEQRDLTQINRQIRQEARSYILDHGKFWVSSLYDPGILDIDAYSTNSYFRKLVVDLRHQDVDWDTMEEFGCYLYDLCTKGRLDHIIIGSLIKERWPLEIYARPNYARPDLIVEYLRTLLNSDDVGREVTVEENFQHTGFIGIDRSEADDGPVSDWDTDSESDSD